MRDVASHYTKKSRLSKDAGLAYVLLGGAGFACAFAGSCFSGYLSSRLTFISAIQSTIQIERVA
jgi:hypothetical protein